MTFRYISFIASSFIVNAVFKRLVSGCGISSLKSGLHIQCNVPAVFHETDTGRVEISALYAYDCILGRVPQICYILVRICDVASGISGNGSDAKCYGQD